MVLQQRNPPIDQASIWRKDYSSPLTSSNKPINFTPVIKGHLMPVDMSKLGSIYTRRVGKVQVLTVARDLMQVMRSGSDFKNYLF